ncbi:MAG: sigma-70 family RNA polymerase sigma factor [Proteobacteria bacterium]|nr:sigma-70 family RNA polymerase sigma factor [Pseudomonadota bacterium]
MSLNRDKEKTILHECLVMNKMDGLVREYGNLVKAIVRKTFMLACIPIIPEDVEDVCMEVFMRLFLDNCRKLKQFDPDKLSLPGWIKLIANQTTIDEIRKKDPHSISRSNERVMIDDVFHLLKYNADQNYDVKEKLGIVIDTIEKMLPNDRMILRMFYCEQLSLEEVSEKLGKSKKTTQTVKDRARRKLIKKVEERLYL